MYCTKYSVYLLLRALKERFASLRAAIKADKQVWLVDRKGCSDTDDLRGQTKEKEIGLIKLVEVRVDEKAFWANRR